MWVCNNDSGALGFAQIPPLPPLTQLPHRCTRTATRKFLGLSFLSFIKSSLFACGVFQDTNNMLTQCTIVYYYIYLHIDDMK
jgi:hypothetical protein